MKRAIVAGVKTSMRRDFLCLVACLAGGLVPAPVLAQTGLLDSDSARVCMSVDVRASVRGFDDITLVAEDVDGSSGADYIGSDTFTLESNAPVQVEVAGIELSNGAYTVSSRFDIDGQGSSFITDGDGSHFGEHVFTVRASLGSVSEQLAGEYTARVVLTVVPLLVVEPQPCPEVAVQPEPVPAGVEEAQAEQDYAEAQSLLAERAAMAAMIAADAPEQLQWAMQAPEGELLFPHLEEFEAWQAGETPVLSDEARYWWMFPQPEVVDELSGAQSGQE